MYRKGEKKAKIQQHKIYSVHEEGKIEKNNIFLIYRI